MLQFLQWLPRLIPRRNRPARKSSSTPRSTYCRIEPLELRSYLNAALLAQSSSPLVYNPEQLPVALSILSIDIPPIISARHPVVERLLMTNQSNSAIVVTGAALLASSDQYVSSALLDPSHQLVNSNKHHLLAAGKSSVLVLKAHRTDSYVNGDYFLVTVIDDSAGRFESIATGGTQSVVTQFLDINGTFVTATPQSVAAGKVTRVTIAASAVSGNCNAKFVTGIEFWLSPDATGPGSIYLTNVFRRMRIAPGQHKTLHIRLLLPATLAAGRYYLFANFNLQPQRQFWEVNRDDLFGGTLAIDVHGISV